MGELKSELLIKSREFVDRRLATAKVFRLKFIVFFVFNAYMRYL